MVGGGGMMLVLVMKGNRRRADGGSRWCFQGGGGGRLNWAEEGVHLKPTDTGNRGEKVIDLISYC